MNKNKLIVGTFLIIVGIDLLFFTSADSIERIRNPNPLAVIYFLAREIGFGWSSLFFLIPGFYLIIREFYIFFKDYYDPRDGSMID